MKFALAFAICVVASAQVYAATVNYRISVTGEATLLRFEDVLRDPNTDPMSIGLTIDVTEPSAFEAEGSLANFYGFTSHSGRAIASFNPHEALGGDNLKYSHCSGLLTVFCRNGGAGFADPASAFFSDSNGNYELALTPVGLTYIDDAGDRFTYFGVAYDYFGGAHFEASIDSFTLEVVPLPASGLLLLTLLPIGAFAARRKRRNILPAS